MKKILMAVSTAVALVAVCGGVAQAQTSSPWKGLHIGASGGGATLKDSSDNEFRFDKTLTGRFEDTILTAGGANAFSPGFCTGAAASNVPSAGCAQDTKGSDFGVRGGYDWQMGRFVVGAIAEFNLGDLTDSVSAFSTTPASYTLTRELDWLGSLGLRSGFGNDRVLIYGSAAGVYASLEHSFATTNTANTFVQTKDDMAYGYQVGGGLEFKLASRLSLGAQYAYTMLDDTDKFTVRAQGPVAATNPFILTNPAGTDMRRADDFKWHSVRGTLSLRF